MWPSIEQAARSVPVPSVQGAMPTDCSQKSCTASGQPLYAPYPLKVAVTAMFTEHALFFGWVEAFATMGVVAALARTEPELLQMKPAARPLRWLWGVLGGLILEYRRAA